MEIQTKCFQVFSEINSLNIRLTELGREAKSVLGQMINSVVSLHSISPLLMKARKAERANCLEEGEQLKGKDRRRCKWWNRGYCREQDGCSFSHPVGDCVEHMQGKCTIRGCTTLRHRKVCKYQSLDVGCLRGSTCEYLHPEVAEVAEREQVEENIRG